MLGPFDYSQFVIESSSEDEHAASGRDLQRKKLMSDDSESTSQAASSAVDSRGEEGRRTDQDEWEQRRSGAMYRGQINEMSRRPDGKGIKVHGGSALYEGFWRDGMCHGLGRGINSKGEVYQGMFSDDAMEGEGFYYWPDGRIFEGTFIAGKKQGKGRFFWPSGQVYEGDFKHDDCHGVGVLFYPDGKRFDGTWKEGNKHGKGAYVFPNGQLYQIVYQNGKKAGDGKLVEGIGPDVKDIKKEYNSLAKKAVRGKTFVEGLTAKQPRTKTTRDKVPAAAGIGDGLTATGPQSRKERDHRARASDGFDDAAWERRGPGDGLGGYNEDFAGGVVRGGGFDNTINDRLDDAGMDASMGRGRY